MVMAQNDETYSKEKKRKTELRQMKKKMKNKQQSKSATEGEDESAWRNSFWDRNLLCMTSFAVFACALW